MLQDVVVDPILADWEIPKDFSILQNPDFWIADTNASNNGTVHKKSIMNLIKNDSSSGTMGILSKVVENKQWCYSPCILSSNIGHEEMNANTREVTHYQERQFQNEWSSKAIT